MDYLVKTSIIFSAIFFPLLLLQLLILLRDFYRKERNIYQLEEEYERVLDARKEFINHYYWSIQSNELDGLTSIKKNIIQSTK